MHPPLNRRLGRTLALAAALLIVPIASPANAASVSGATSAAGATSSAVTGATTTAPAAATGAKPGAKSDATPDAVSVCPPAKPGSFTCFALRRTDVATHLGVDPALTPAGYGPADLLSAYSLPADGGAGATVAIVDAYDDPNAESDLAQYRAQFGLPACTTANGCFRKTDQNGGTSYPAANSGWAGEISLDLDMVSAVAPRAHIILVEGASSSDTDLGASVDEAVALGAGYVSNSYGSPYTSAAGSGEDPSETTDLDAYYNHPGVAVVASSGDGNYGVAYPAASQYVTSVGGTSLVHDSSARGWSESVWNNSHGGPGSGCSVYEPKPAFQTDTGCPRRTVTDVSAVADPTTGVAVYDSYQDSGWDVFGGTSAASPLIAAVYADAGTPAAGTYPNSYPYQNPSALNDVTQGSNGSCSPAYLCTAGVGYDGPTGLGTPNGLTAFSTGPHGVVHGTVTDGSAPIAGAQVTVGTNVTHTAADGTYSLTVPAGTYTVTATDYGYGDESVSGVVVADGGDVAEDFTLTEVPRATVSGTVTDGSGQGWPLYAAITVDGVPGGPVYTDPKTGAYSITLPADHSYTLHTSAVYSGYDATTTAVDVGADPVTAPISVPVTLSTCHAPGYAFATQGLAQSFDTAATPAGWTVSNGTASGGWEFDDPGRRGNVTGGAGGFAIVDSDYLGSGKSQDTYLTSPVVDLSAVDSPELDFSTYYRPYGNSTATAQISVDGGATWTSVWSHTADTVPGSRVQLPLPQAAGQSAVQVRFHYTGTWAFYWELDDVLLGRSTCGPVPGGLVFGQVTDANTGAALAGVSVAEAAAPSVGATSAVLPDPALTGAFYSFFSPTAGSVPLTATKTRYAAWSGTAAVASSGVVEADVPLAAGRLTVTPAAVARTVAWGGTAQQDVTVKNTGGGPATLKLGEQPGGFTIQGVPAAGAPATLVPAHVITGDAKLAQQDSKPAAAAVHAADQTAGAAWQPVADFPKAIQDDIADFSGGKLYAGFGFDGAADSNKLFAYDPASGTWSARASATDVREAPAHGFIGGKLYVVGGWGSSGSPDPTMEVYDPATDTWSTGTPVPAAYAGSGSAVVGNKLYVVGGCVSSCGTTDVYAYDSAAGTWSKLAPYPQVASWLSCGGIEGELYCAGGSGTASQSAYAYDPAANAWTALASAPAGFWGAASAVADGQLVVTGGVVNNALSNQTLAYDPTDDSWSTLPNSNVNAYRFAGALGFYTVGGSKGSGIAPLATAQLLPGYDVGPATDVSWLSENATTLTLAPGASATLKVTVNAADASIAQPGDYTAALQLGSDTPYKLAPIPVTMTVKPPASWGKVAGVVSYTDASGHQVPLAGATLQINAGSVHYTLHTDVNGAYSLWLDSHNSPLTLIAAKDGYQPQTVNVKIKKGATTTANFVLLTD